MLARENQQHVLDKCIVNDTPVVFREVCEADVFDDGAKGAVGQRRHFRGHPRFGFECVCCVLVVRGLSSFSLSSEFVLS